MLARENRLRTKDIARILGRSQTNKIIAYPFVYFVQTIFLQKEADDKPQLQRGIQIPTKISKRSVVRHKIKRMFYDLIDQLYEFSYISQKNTSSDSAKKQATSQHTATSGDDLQHRKDKPARATRYMILAIPQKVWIEELAKTFSQQLLAKKDKTAIMETIHNHMQKSLLLLQKKSWYSAESKRPFSPSNNVRKN